MQRSQMQWRQGAQPPTFEYANRELSWLAFNRRVLSEADNPDNPLLERIRFLSITASNLDEFYMVRFASLRLRMRRGDDETDPAGMTPAEQMERIKGDAGRLMREQVQLWRDSLLPALAREGIRFWTMTELNVMQLKWMETCFAQEILPHALIAARRAEEKRLPVAGRALQFGFLIEAADGGIKLATLRAPSGMRRAWALPEDLGGGYVMLEDMMALFAKQVLPRERVLGCWPFRITRDEDFTVPEDSPMNNLVAETQRSLSKRKKGDIVRLEVDAGAPPALCRQLVQTLDVEDAAIHRLEGPLNLTFLNRELYDLPGRATLRFSPFVGRLPARLSEYSTLFDTLQAGDVFLHHPYDSFDTVLRFIREAATDPRVLAINMMLYRVSGDSPIIRSLCEAAEAGKRVTVLVELKARFDEENNLRWSDVLKRAGCEVLYGIPRLKTHSKITLVVRREGTGLRRYVHLGTGNYNDVTARQYTDMGLMTCDAALGEDAQAFFNMITGFAREPRMQRLIYAPRWLRHELMSLIEQEIEHAQAGRPCGICAKMNSLVDEDVIRLLYEAGGAGVPIRLMIRGVCCLRAGVPGLSENIQVRSIVGRFLEHSRVFCFENGGNSLTYLSSADWMPRNLNRRVELMFPITDARVRARIVQVLDMQWADNMKAWQMQPDGAYKRVPREGEPVNAQEALITASQQENPSAR